MRGLAYRRHQWRRARERAHRYLRWISAPDRQWVTPKAVARHAIDRTPCSCALCGNPRRYTGEVTRQERRAELERETGDVVP